MFTVGHFDRARVGSPPVIILNRVDLPAPWADDADDRARRRDEAQVSISRRSPKLLETF